MVVMQFFFNIHTLNTIYVKQNVVHIANIIYIKPRIHLNDHVDLNMDGTLKLGSKGGLCKLNTRVKTKVLNGYLSQQSDEAADLEWRHNSKLNTRGLLISMSRYLNDQS